MIYGYGGGGTTPAGSGQTYYSKTTPPRIQYATRQPTRRGLAPWLTQGAATSGGLPPPNTSGSTGNWYDSQLNSQLAAAAAAEQARQEQLRQAELLRQQEQQRIQETYQLNPYTGQPITDDQGNFVPLNPTTPTPVDTGYSD